MKKGKEGRRIEDFLRWADYLARKELHEESADNLAGVEEEYEDDEAARLEIYEKVLLKIYLEKVFFE